MAQLAPVLLSGLLAGSVHVVTGVDHLAALLPLSVGRRLAAFGTGARWGVGHSAGVALVGLLALLLRRHLHVETMSAWAETAVGLVLVAIGAFGVRRALGIHAHVHAHGAEAAAGHVHFHAHALGQGGHLHDHTAFAAGTLHGVAGTAHLLGVLPALALPGPAAAAYLGAFAAGTILAMGAFAALVGEGTARASSGAPRLLRPLLLGASTLTVTVGLLWIAFSLAGSHA